MGPGYWGGHGFGFMWLFPLIFFLLFIYLLSRMFGQNQNTSSNKQLPPKPESAREILDKRYAKGEISKDEYEAIKNTLEQNK